MYDHKNLIFTVKSLCIPNICSTFAADFYLIRDKNDKIVSS